MKRGQAKARADIATLCTNEFVQEKYIVALDRMLTDEPVLDVETVNTKILESVQNAIEEVCPKQVPDKLSKPWESNELHRLYVSQRGMRGPELRKIRKTIKTLQSKLMNDYYAEKSANINHAAEARQVAKEFKQIKQYDKVHGGKSKLLISNHKLHAHFELKFDEDPDFELPEELLDPENQDFFKLNEADNVDESEPTEAEVSAALKRLRNRKSPGVDKCPLEGLKYGRESCRLMKYLMVLVCTIWSSLVVPKIWLE